MGAPPSVAERPRMNARAVIYPAAILLVAGLVYLFSKPEAPPPAPQTAAGTAMVAVTLPDTLGGQAALGKAAFEANCASCHGKDAAGHLGKGPPLVHRIYEPGHHGDTAFLMAANRGVQAHHWEFGNMPPVKGLTKADIANIVAYVRELQRENGIE